jgi:hypothetical protein
LLNHLTIPVFMEMSFDNGVRVGTGTRGTSQPLSRIVDFGEVRNVHACAGSAAPPFSANYRCNLYGGKVNLSQPLMWRQAKSPVVRDRMNSNKLP